MLASPPDCTGQLDGALRYIADMIFAYLLLYATRGDMTAIHAILLHRFVIEYRHYHHILSSLFGVLRGSYGR